MTKRSIEIVHSATLPGLQRRLFLRWVPFLVAVSLLGLGACGRKAPPVPPNRPPLPAVTELTGRLQDETVTLTWQRSPAARGVAGYIVLRAQTSAANPPCAGCPLVFQKVGELGKDSGTGSFEFSEPVRTGFIYTYKVQPLGTSGDRGHDSNTVIIDRSN